MHSENLTVHCQDTKKGRVSERGSEKRARGPCYKGMEERVERQTLNPSSRCHTQSERGRDRDRERGQPIRGERERERNKRDRDREEHIELGEWWEKH